MKNKITVIWIVIALLIVFISVYFVVFGRALKQSENHFGIFLALPEVMFSSGAVAIDNQKYLAKNVTAFIKTMESQSFTYVDQMGSGYFLEKDGISYLSTSRMYSSHFMIFTYPAVVNQPLINNVVIDKQPAVVNSEWLKITQAIYDCQVVSIMQAHSLAVSADLKDGRKLEAIEPEIDNIMNIALNAEKNCGRIIMATE